MISILTSTKKLAGMTEEYTAYDDQIIMYINSTLLRLKQIGVGPSEGFVVTGYSETWEQLIPNDKFLRESTKAYVGAKVKMQFDPPTASSAIEALKQMISEYEWCLNVEAESNPVEEPTDKPSDDPIVNKDTIGVVVDCTTLFIRSKPDPLSEVLGTLTRGAEVIIDKDDSADEFYKVKTSNGITGYCDKDYIEIKT